MRVDEMGCGIVRAQTRDLGGNRLRDGELGMFRGWRKRRVFASRVRFAPVSGDRRHLSNVRAYRMEDRLER